MKDEKKVIHAKLDEQRTEFNSKIDTIEIDVEAMVKQKFEYL